MGVTLVLGPERFLAREAARAALASDDLDVARHGADARLADVLDDLRTPSLLGGRRGDVRCLFVRPSTACFQPHSFRDERGQRQRGLLVLLGQAGRG